MRVVESQPITDYVARTWTIRRARVCRPTFLDVGLVLDPSATFNPLNERKQAREK